jgi:hypothetical protein
MLGPWLTIRRVLLNIEKDVAKGADKIREYLAQAEELN